MIREVSTETIWFTKPKIFTRPLPPAGEGTQSVYEVGAGEVVGAARPGVVHIISTPIPLADISNMAPLRCKEGWEM